LAQLGALCLSNLCATKPPENGTYEIEDALFKEWIMDEA
jgi:hypothetical protein